MMKDPGSGIKYQVVDQIGKGSYGECFHVYDTRSEKPYACKRVRHDNKYPDEGEVHQKLKHKNIVQLFSLWNDGGFQHLIMEICMFGTLKDLLNCRSSLVDSEICCITRDVVAGLIYLHDAYIIHGDLKLSNLLISSSFVVKICDFGFSKQLAPSNMTRKTICGTNSYMAPEVLGEGESSLPADVWALGCILYQLRTGKTPFCGRTANEKMTNTRLVLLHQSQELSTHLWKLLRAILVEDPALRPKTSEILGYGYFRDVVSPDKLDISVFYQPWQRPKRGKKLALRDTTNTIQNITRKVGKAKGQENCSNIGMQLRPRFKIQIEECEDLQEILQNGGKFLAVRLLEVLKNANPKIGTEGKLKTSDEPFQCVVRWVAGLQDLAYHLSDGSYTVCFYEKIIVHQPKEGEVSIFQKMGSKVPEGSAKEDMMTTVGIIESAMKNLSETGKSVPYNKPVLVVAHKYFPSVEAKAEFPKVAFLLSNGSCQINFINHEKLIVNAHQDFVAFWTEEECKIGRLSELLQKTPRARIEQMLTFIKYFLVGVANKDKK